MISKSSPDWPSLRDHLQNEITSAMDALAETGCPTDRASEMRGRIQAYRDLLTRVEPAIREKTAVKAVGSHPGY